MKYLFSLILLLYKSFLFAQAGYEIKVTLKPFKNQYIYLGHYYGKQLPIIDSVKVNNESQGTFKGSKSLGGGIYLIGYPDRAHNFEILVDKNQHFSVAGDTAHLQSVSFINSKDNVAFRAYQDYMTRNGKLLDGLYSQRRGASVKDSVALTEK